MGDYSGFGVVVMDVGRLVCLLVLFCYLGLLDTITLWVVAVVGSFVGCSVVVSFVWILCLVVRFGWF